MATQPTLDREFQHFPTKAYVTIGKEENGAEYFLEQLRSNGIELEDEAEAKAALVALPYATRSQTIDIVCARTHELSLTASTETHRIVREWVDRSGHQPCHPEAVLRFMLEHPNFMGADRNWIYEFVMDSVQGESTHGWRFVLFENFNGKGKRKLRVEDACPDSVCYYDSVWVFGQRE